MDLPEFIILVAEMRRLQKEYFRHRDPLSLQKAKKIEALIDVEIERMTGRQEPVKKPNYPTLF